MKKRLLISVLAAVFFILPVSALDHGPTFGAGISGAMKLYTNESFAYQLQWDNFGVDMGVRLMQNIFYNPSEPFLYILPTVNIYIGSKSAKYYLGGGLFFTPSPLQEGLGYHVRTGCLFGNWDWGEGICNMDIGLEMTPTIFYVNSEDKQEEAWGTLVGTLFNIFKINVGVIYMLPL